MEARDRATWVASGARAGEPHGNHLYPKWSSVPPDHLGYEATDEDAEEAHAFYHHTHPPGFGGVDPSPRGSSLSWGLLLVASSIPPTGGREGGKRELLGSGEQRARNSEGQQRSPGSSARGFH